MKYSVKYKKVFDKNDNIVDIDSVEKENKELMDKSTDELRDLLDSL